MASPHVAGAAALAFAKVPEATVLGVKNAILDGVDKKASSTGATGVASGGRLNLNGMLTRLACCHARPAGATPLRVPLVPAYNQCTSPNRVHGPPDLPGGTNPDGSCAPPVQRSTQLTVGTPDANRWRAANSVGSYRIAADRRGPGHAGGPGGCGRVGQHHRRARQDRRAPGLFRAAPGTHAASHDGPPQRRA